MIRILLADDHYLVRAGIKSLLKRQNHLKVIAEANSGEQAIALSNEYQPDIILMDIKMPGIGGLEATRTIAQNQPMVNVIALTVCYNEPYPSQLMEAGASGYLTKDTEVPEMLNAIHSVYQGKPYIAENIRQCLANKQDQQLALASLSEREMQVMMLTIDGMRPMEIAKHLMINQKTVNSYRYRIFEKLKVQNDVELTRFAMLSQLISANGH